MILESETRPVFAEETKHHVHVARWTEQLPATSYAIGWAQPPVVPSPTPLQVLAMNWTDGPDPSGLERIGPIASVVSEPYSAVREFTTV
ncbi:unnamed protein product, partial [Mesorhabditis belari]|uniref:Uncharacterized protein n=1 Tax=Mesorhabditis belari TaxID=2138241 RepID=A0AAF3FD17_9BILA